MARRCAPAAAAVCGLIALPRTWAACPGTVEFGNSDGSQTITIVTPTQAGPVDVWGGQVVTHLGGRAYFAETCMSGWFDHSKYMGTPLLGRTFRYTTDMSGAGCGCCASLYLVSMKQNAQACTSNDYYCDANAICGVRCPEIDLQESNQYAWRSTLHKADDPGGKAMGFGGGATDWTQEEYGPGAKCIDTKLPFEVALSFKVDTKGAFSAMEVTLSQEGHSCPLTSRIDNYTNMAEISSALAAGMTPVASYWSNNDMKWLDTPPCQYDNAGACGNSVKYYGFSIEEMKNPVYTTTTTTTTTTTPTTRRDRNASTTSSSMNATATTTLRPPDADGAAGFCCVGARNTSDFCPTCFEDAVERKGSHCGESRSNCESCGHGSTWCEALSLSDGMMLRAQRAKPDGAMQPRFDETLRKGKRPAPL